MPIVPHSLVTSWIIYARYDHVSREIRKDPLKKKRKSTISNAADRDWHFQKDIFHLTNQSDSIKELRSKSVNILSPQRERGNFFRRNILENISFHLGHAIDSGHLDNLDEFPDENSRVVVGRRSGRATSKGFRVDLHSWRAFHYRVHRFQGYLLHLGKLQREYIYFSLSIRIEILSRLIKINDMINQDSVYISCNNLYLMIVVLKVGVLYAHKMEFFDLVTFTRNNFWRSYPDPEEELILAECKRICTIFVVVISFCAQGTCTGYMITPIIGNSRWDFNF